MEDCDVVAVEIVSPKEEEQHLPPEVYHIAVNYHYSFYLYYNDIWCFDLIQTVLHNLQPLRYLK